MQLFHVMKQLENGLCNTPHRGCTPLCAFSNYATVPTGFSGQHECFARTEERRRAVFEVQDKGRQHGCFPCDYFILQLYLAGGPCFIAIQKGLRLSRKGEGRVCFAAGETDEAPPHRETAPLPAIPGFHCKQDSRDQRTRNRVIYL